MQDDVYSFSEVGNNFDLITYDGSNFVDGKMELGKLMSEDHSVHLWSIVESKHGFALEITPLFDGFDDKGEFIHAKDTNSVFMLPFSDDCVAELDNGLENITFFKNAQDAFDTFKTVVYSSEDTDIYYEASRKAKEVIGDYSDPFSCDFETFKNAFHNACTWLDFDRRYVQTPLANAMLSVRYPFLIPFYSFRNQEEGPKERLSQPFNHTAFQSIPDGWQRRFGLELCEDLRNQAYDEDERVWIWRMCNMFPDQIKEKFGGLRWYGPTYGRGEKLIDAYERISYNVCIHCGKSDKLRITRGWIAPMCWTETTPTETKELHEGWEEKYLGSGEDDWNHQYAAWKVGEYEYALSTTDAGNTSESLSNMLSNWEWKTYSKDGDLVVNEAIGLLDGSPAPNGEPIWARKIILEVVEDIKRLEEYGYDPVLDKYLDVLGLNKDELVPWWNNIEAEENV